MSFSSFSAEVVALLLQARYALALGTTSVHLFGSLLLTVLGGVAVPVGHQTLRWLFRRYANKIREEEAARDSASGASGQTTDGK